MNINSNLIQINPIIKTKIITYTQMEIKILNMVFGENQCEIQVIIYDDTRENSKSFCYLISAVDYLNWTTDNYIINWVKNKLSQEIF